MQASPKPKDARKFLFLPTQTDKRAANPLRTLRGDSRFDPEGKRKMPPRLRTKAGLITVAAVDGDRVSVTGEGAPLARFTVDGCTEQE